MGSSIPDNLYLIQENKSLAASSMDIHKHNFPINAVHAKKLVEIYQFFLQLTILNHFYLSVNYILFIKIFLESKSISLSKIYKNIFIYKNICTHFTDLLRMFYFIIIEVIFNKFYKILYSRTAYLVKLFVKSCKF